MNITRTILEIQSSEAPLKLLEVMQRIQNAVDKVPLDYRHTVVFSIFPYYDGTAGVEITYEAPETPEEERARLLKQEHQRALDAETRKWLKDPANIKTEEAKHWK